MAATATPAQLRPRLRSQVFRILQASADTLAGPVRLVVVTSFWLVVKLGLRAASRPGHGPSSHPPTSSHSRR